jgi:pimeloyl-ACP methyl ester carboxylesterase
VAYFGTSDGARIFYTDTGQGKPVLLLHGWACDGNDWSWQAPELENRYRVIIVDHRGHGRSTAPRGSSARRCWPTTRRRC